MMNAAKDWNEAYVQGHDACGTADDAWARESASNSERTTTSDDSGSTVKAWPTILPVASHGLVGQIAQAATQNSEADPIAVMGTALAATGAMFGRSRFILVGETRHHARTFVNCVGASSRARKGTSTGPVLRIVEVTEGYLQHYSTRPFPLGLPLRISHGPLSSGEGLIDAIRDKRDEEDTGGKDDKRLLLLEGELGAALRAFQRQGNTLSAILRGAWDGVTLEPLTKREKIVATEPHICIVAHITKRELDELMTTSDLWNGFANRFVWLTVRRRAVVPFPKEMADDDVARIAQELARVVVHAHANPGPLRFSNSAADHWAAVYPELTRDYPGILGAVTARAEAQALRIALTYALLDGAERIELPHLEAGLAFWRYAHDFAAYLFDGAELDPVAQTILGALATGPKTQTELRDLFGRHLPAPRLNQVLGDLQERGRITLREEPTKGRPRSTWSMAS